MARGFHVHLLDEYLRLFNGGRDLSPEQEKTARRMREALDAALDEALADQRESIARMVSTMADTWARAGFKEHGEALRTVAKDIRNME